MGTIKKTENKITPNEIRATRLLISAGIIVRIVFFVINLTVVTGLQIDEAMTSLNAFTLARRGNDLLGNSMPVYFSTWINGGQSPVATYLCALSAFIFGDNLFAVRLPALITGIAGQICFTKLCKELFSDKKLGLIVATLGTFSPWMIFSCVFVLDCNFFGYMMIFALLLLNKAVKGDCGTKKTAVIYISSMFFFALAFNAYMASVLVVPVFLAVFFIIMLISRKIEFRFALISCFSLLIFSLPFILFGFVSVGIIPEFSVGPFTFGGMDDYKRAATLAFADGNVLNILKSMIANLRGSFDILFFSLSTMLIGVGVNIFQFGSIFSGVFLLAGAISIFISKKLNKYEKAILIAVLVSILSFCAITNDAHLRRGYRYGVLSPLLVLIEGVGLYAIISKIKKIDAKKFTVAYIVTAVCLFSFVFFYQYLPQTDSVTDLTYGDTLKECMDYLEQKDCDDCSLVFTTYEEQRRISVYLRFYYDPDSFVNFYDEYKNICRNKLPSMRVSDKFTFFFYDESFVFKDDNYIVSKFTMKKLSGYDDYSVKDFGPYVILEKQ